MAINASVIDRDRAEYASQLDQCLYVPRISTYMSIVSIHILFNNRKTIS
jgi:hypothetical protein